MIFQKYNQVEWTVFPKWANDSRLVHAFTTRKGGVSEGNLSSLNLGRSQFDSDDNVETNRQRVFQALDVPSDRVLHCHQIHSATVRRVDEPGILDACDGVITNAEDLYLIIGVADCHTIFLTTKDRKVVGALHAGWRGTVKGIFPTAIEKIQREYGYGPEQLEIGISPAIGVCCYEVGEEVANQFDSNDVDRSSGSAHLDLAAALARQGEKAGIPKEQISIADRCTSCEEDNWFSYRRDNKVTGRMWGIIGKRKH